jgi:GT2 family glycosyltransferase
MVDISAIIVNWNTKQLVTECIQSMLEHRGQYTLEVIIVDNASEDGSASTLRKLFTEVKIIENSNNVGFAGANNQGIDVASGRYICLVNSDVKFIEDSFGKMLDYMDKHLEIGMLGPKLLWADKTLQWSCRKYPSLWNTLCPALGLNNLFPRSSLFSGEHMVYFNHNMIKEVDVLVGAFMFVRHAALKQVGKMDDGFFMYCEEVDWCKRFADAGWKINFFPVTEVMHYGGGSSSAGSVRLVKEYCLSNLRYWKKHHSGIKVTLFRLTLMLRYLLRLPVWFILSVMIPQKRKTYNDKIHHAVSGLSALVTPHRFVSVF